MRSDELFDALILLLLITALLGIGGKAIINERNKVVEYNAEYVQDKNTKRDIDNTTYTLYGLGEGTYTFAEVVLAFQIQSQYMPQPHKLSIGYATKDTYGTDHERQIYMEPVDILADFDGFKDIYTGRAEKFALKIKAEYGEELNDMLFTLEIDRGASLADPSDDFYLFKYKPKNT